MSHIDFGLIKPYLRKENIIGIGTYGHVYKGCLKTKNLDVAIKKIYYSSEEVLRERDILGRIYNDHIIQIIDTIFESPRSKNIYLILEYMDGGTLYNLVHDNTQKYNFVDVMNWFLQAAKGLEYLHSLTPIIIHRDVKPENMLLDASRKTLKFCDLGKSTECKTIMTGKSGTGIYMAPEIFDNKYDTKYDTKADIYSLCISIAETLIRRHPYHQFMQEKPTDLELAQEIYNKKIRPDISNIKGHGTEEVRMLMTKGWDFNAKNRPTAQDFVKLFENTLRLYP
ncbi:mitogen-activated protein kinase kinase kinase 7-like [Drosophila innubila]|uniref:mitogen-activated protein kinase kinase kinase 7-like n=1 Tax=Drosophila innubila TaxID=198719 RepID=UPI00148DDEB6|nr:mitogen-activated protein kinase kinase kinase 7-like [Drosophila innubila]XP_034486801.1 mitogen-activated protein kinase kinase kinase 7-like [Drosophila innubila]